MSHSFVGINMWHGHPINHPPIFWLTMPIVGNPFHDSGITIAEIPRYPLVIKHGNGTSPNYRFVFTVQMPIHSGIQFQPATFDCPRVPFILRKLDHDSKENILLLVKVVDIPIISPLYIPQSHNTSNYIHITHIYIYIHISHHILIHFIHPITIGYMSTMIIPPWLQAVWNTIPSWSSPLGLHWVNDWYRLIYCVCPYIHI